MAIRVLTSLTGALLKGSPVETRKDATLAAIQVLGRELRHLSQGRGIQLQHDIFELGIADDEVFEPPLREGADVVYDRLRAPRESEALAVASGLLGLHLDELRERPAANKTWSWRL